MSIDPTAMVRSAVNLKALAAEINAAHEAGEKFARDSLERFRAAGEALLKVKKQVGHGNFQDWLRQNVRCSYRTAQQYMRVAREWSRCAAAAHLGDALRFLTEKAKDPEDAPANGQATETGEQQPPAEEQPRPTEPEPGDDTDGQADAEAVTGSSPEPPTQDEPKIPERLKQYFEHVEKFERAARLAVTLANLVQEIEQTPAYLKAVEGKEHRREHSTFVRSAGRAIEFMTPKRPCPECGSGEHEPSPDSEPCTACGDKGYQTVEDLDE